LYQHEEEEKEREREKILLVKIVINKTNHWAMSMQARAMILIVE